MEIKTSEVPTQDDLQDVLEQIESSNNYEQTISDNRIKFIVDSKMILDSINKVMGVIPTNPVIPILENFLLTESHILGSDLQTSIRVPLSANGLDNEKFSIAVPARMFRDWLKRLPKQPITIEVEIENSAITVLSDNGRYTFACEDGGDFPLPAEPKGTTQLMFNQSEFLESVKGLVHFTSDDEMKPAMQGVYMEFKDNSCTFVATDSHSMKVYGIDYKWDGNMFHILPNANCLRQLVKVASNDKGQELQVEFNETNIFFYANGIEIISRLIDEKFVDYKNVIPSKYELVGNVEWNTPKKFKGNFESVLKSVVVDRKQLIETIKRGEIFANRTSFQIQIHINSSDKLLTVRAEDVDFSNESKESIPIESALLFSKDKDFIIGFNSRKLTACLESYDTERVTLYVSQPNRAVLIEGDRELETVLLMPVQLGCYY